MVMDNSSRMTGLPKPAVREPSHGYEPSGRDAQQVYDQQAVTLRRAYEAAKNENVIAARDLPRDVRDRIQNDVIAPCGAVVSNANVLPSILGMPVQEEVITRGPNGAETITTRRLAVVPDLFMVAALRTKLEVPQQLAGVDQRAAQIVADAAAAAVPGVPPLCSEQEVAARTTQLTTILAGVSASNAAGVAAQLLDTAIREQDQLTQHVLLGDRLRYVYAAGGVQVGQLRQRYLNALASATPAGTGLMVDASPTAPVELGGFRLSQAPGVAFAQLQRAGSDQRLADLPRLARAYWDYQYAMVRGLLDLATARARGMDVSGL